MDKTAAINSTDTRIQAGRNLGYVSDMDAARYDQTTAAATRQGKRDEVGDANDARNFAQREATLAQGGELRKVQLQTAQMAYNRAVDENKMPAAVDKEYKSLAENYRDKTKTIDTAKVEGSLTPEGEAALRAEQSAIANRMSQLMNPYLPEGLREKPGAGGERPIPTSVELAEFKKRQGNPVAVAGFESRFGTAYTKNSDSATTPEAATSGQKAGAEKATGLIATSKPAKDNSVIGKMQQEKIQELDGIAEEYKQAQTRLAAVAKSGDSGSTLRYSKESQAIRNRLKDRANELLGNGAEKYLRTAI